MEILFLPGATGRNSFKGVPIDCLATCYCVAIVQILIGMIGLYFTFSPLIKLSTEDGSECTLPFTFLAISACIIMFIGVSGCIGAIWCCAFTSAFPCYVGRAHSSFVLMYAHAKGIALLFMFIFSIGAVSIDSGWQCFEYYDKILVVISMIGIMVLALWCSIHRYKIKLSHTWYDRGLPRIEDHHYVSTSAIWIFFNVLYITLATLILRQDRLKSDIASIYIIIAFLVMIGFGISSCLINFWEIYKMYETIIHAMHGQAIVCAIMFGFTVTTLAMSRPGESILLVIFACFFSIFAFCSLCIILPSIWDPYTVIYSYAFRSYAFQKHGNSAPPLFSCLCPDRVNRFWDNVFISMEIRDRDRKERWKQNQVQAIKKKEKHHLDTLLYYLPKDIAQIIKDYTGASPEVLEAIENAEMLLKSDGVTPIRIMLGLKPFSAEIQHKGPQVVPL